MKVVLACLLTATLVNAAPAFAGCKSDYESCTEDCQRQHGDDPNDSDDQRRCVDDCHDEYESCVNN